MQGKQAILDVLNQLLLGEFAAVDQYLFHAEIYADRGLKVLAEKSLHESEHERTHARALIQRILFLQGTPNYAARPAITIGATVEEMLKADLALEYKVAGELKAAIELCEKHQDYVTRELLVVQLDDTENDHAYYLEKQLRLIQALGLQNYLQSQMGN